VSYPKTCLCGLEALENPLNAKIFAASTYLMVDVCNWEICQALNVLRIGRPVINDQGIHTIHPNAER